MRRLICYVLLALLLSGCGGYFGEAIRVQPNARVIVVNAIEDDILHGHVGLTVFTNYRNAIENDWSLSDYSESLVTRWLSEAGYVVVNVELPETMKQTVINGDHTGTPTVFHLNHQLRTWVDQQLQTARADALVLLQTSASAMLEDVGPKPRGIAVRTAHGSPPSMAVLSLHLDGPVYYGSPPTFAHLPASALRNCRLVLEPSQFGLDDWKKLSAEHLAAFKEPVLDMAARSLDAYLKSSGLLSGTIEGCRKFAERVKSDPTYADLPIRR